MAKRAKKRNAWGPFGSRETYRVTRAPGRANETRYKGYRVWQHWPEGFKTSADPESTFDSMKDVKAFLDWVAKNPGKPGSAFKRCVAAVSEKGGAYDPRAVCAAAGRKKYGAKEYAAMAKAGRKRAARGNPKRPRGLWPRPYEIDQAINRRAQAMARTRRGFTRAQSDDAADKLIAALYGKNSLIPETERHKIHEVLWNDFNSYPRGYKGFHRTAAGRRMARMGNPAEAAAEVYEEFHGRPSSEVVTVTEKIHYHEHLSAIGDLRSMVVLARDGGRITLSRFKKAILCTNEAKNQLFIRGGDQSVDLRTFGVRTEHEVETLGKVSEIVYFTTKDHLGDEGGTALYFHITGETNENGKRKMVGWAPDLIYHTIDERLEFSGGSYTIRAEGIDK